jgi:hypothetical protein
MDARTSVAITARVPTTIPSIASVVKADDLEDFAVSAAEVGGGLSVLHDETYLGEIIIWGRTAK